MDETFELKSSFSKKIDLLYASFKNIFQVLIDLNIGEYDFLNLFRQLLTLLEK